MKNAIEIKTIKVEIEKHGTRKYMIKDTVWKTELILTSANGNQRVIPSMNYANPQKLKRDAVKKAREYSDYILSNQKMYFDF
jgi:hypothetical protein